MVNIGSNLGRVNPLKKTGLEDTGLGKAGRGLDTIVRKGVPGLVKGDTQPYKEGLEDVSKGLYGVGGEEVKELGQQLAQNNPFQIGDVDFDESAFKDDHWAKTHINELIAQQAGARGRENTNFDTAAAQLADAQMGQAAKIATEDQAQFRQGQQDLIAALQQQAAGQGPSLAGMQLDDARNQQIETAMALAASQRGLGAGQGLRSIAQQTQQAGQFAAREAAKARIAEQLAARQQLTGALSGARAQDIGLATSQAGLEQQTALANQAAANQFALQQGAMEQQTALANQQSQLAAQAQQDALMNALNQQLAGAAQYQEGKEMDLERMKLQRDLQLEGLRTGQFQGLLSAGAQGLTAALAGA